MLRTIALAAGLVGLLAPTGCSQPAPDTRADVVAPAKEKAKEEVAEEKKPEIDPVEDKAVKAVWRMDGKVTRDEALPDKPVVEVLVAGDRGTDPDLEALLAFKKLRSLTITGPNVQFTVRGVKQLVGIETLTELSIDGWKLTDEQLKELTAFKNLTSLHISTEGLTDAGIKELSSFKKLTALRLFGRTGVTNSPPAWLKHVAALTNLTSLHLVYVDLLEEGLKELAALKNLTALTTFGCRISDEGMKELAAFKKLKSLSLQEGVTGKGYRELAALPELRELVVRNVPIEVDEAVQGIVAIKTLNRLVLSSSLVTDQELERLTALPNLTELDITFAKVTPAGVEKFQKARPKCKVLWSQYKPVD